MFMPKGRVLIVDDESSLLASHAHSLTDAGFEVDQALSGAEALRCLETRHFDAVLSDMSMPRMNGLALLRRLRKRAPDLPVILMQDTPDNHITMEATELGAIQSLVKPVAAELLAEAAAYAVRVRRSRQQIATALYDDEREHKETSHFTATEAKNDFARAL